jgi:hypothetical protein
MDLNKLYPYDCETYPTVFTMWIGNAGKKRAWKFEISDRIDERKRMIKFLGQIKSEEASMVGFNNIGFDYPVIHFIMYNQECTVREIYDKAMAIIFAKDEERFAHTIWENQWIIPQIDLFKVHHFDNMAKATSLKMLEFNMRSDNIEDLPFPVGSILTPEETDVLLKYNKHDMSQTDKFMNISMPQLDFREKLSLQYGKNFMNHNDGKIGKDYFIMKLEEELPGSCYRQEGNKKVVNQTRRKSIKLKECIFDYIKFDRPEFNAVLAWLQHQEITQTKGVFIDILENELGELAKYAELTKKRQKLFSKPSDKKIADMRLKHPAGWVSEEELKSGKNKVSYYWNWNVADCLNCVIDGFRYDFGTGGLHGAVKNKIFTSTSKRVIRTEDVASYYPNMGISNRVYPLHLGESFCDIYLDVYKQRSSFKKGTPENAMLKLALNSVYGDSNNQFSPFFDPKYTMTITIGGQLSLCMLAEKLLKVPTLEIIMVNTDGLEFIVDREYDDQAGEICRAWEKMTGLVLEGGMYQKMCIANVNNYIAVSEGSGKIKRKGAYGYIRPDQKDAELGWHSNHSSLVIAMAAEKALLEDEEIGYFIRRHVDHMDFMLRAKVPRSSKLIVVDETGDEQKLQNICRYYACKSGEGELVKIMPPLAKARYGKRMQHTETLDEVVTLSKTENDKYLRKDYILVEDILLENEERRIGINTGTRVKVCNDIKEYKGDIDYDFYIAEAHKLVDPLLEGA